MKPEKRTVSKQPNAFSTVSCLDPIDPEEVEQVITREIQDHLVSLIRLCAYTGRTELEAKLRLILLEL